MREVSEDWQQLRGALRSGDVALRYALSHAGALPRTVHEIVMLWLIGQDRHHRGDPITFARPVLDELRIGSTTRCVDLSVESISHLADRLLRR